MSPFDPANPSAQKTIVSQPLAQFAVSSDSGILDVTGFRQLNLSTNVPVANPAGTTIEVDELRADGVWYPVLFPAPIVAIGQNRLFVPAPFASMIRVKWVLGGIAVFGYTLIGQS